MFSGFFNQISIVKTKAVRLYNTKALGGEKVQLLLILNLGTRGGEWSASRPDRPLPPEKEPSASCPFGQEAR
jgi:hypothetical protein